MESKRPYPLEDWPAERVAAKPPMVAYSNDCGKWPSVNPDLARAVSASGPRSPAPSRAVIETASTSVPRRFAVSRLMTARKPARAGRTPPTTLVPPPNGTTATEALEHASSNGCSRAPESMLTTASGASAIRPDRRSSRSARLCPPECRSLSSREADTLSRPAASRTASGISTGSGSLTDPMSGIVTFGSVAIPRSESIRSAPAGREVSCPGSPQPHHRVSRRGPGISRRRPKAAIRAG